MQTVLRALSADLSRVRAELHLYSVLDDALASRFDSDRDALRDYNSRAKRMTYSNIIIGCYGLIEQTIDAALLLLADALGRLYSSFGDIPEGVRSHQRELILQYLRDGENARTRNKVNERFAIEALMREPAQTPGLVAEVFTLSSANYRFEYVKHLFSRLAVKIEDDGLSRAAPVDVLEKAGFAGYKSFLDDFVQRRNDLAHSYGDDNIVDPDLLDSYIDLVDGYLHSIACAVNHSVITLLTQLKLSPIGTVAKTWTGRIGFEMNAGKLAVGDRILLAKENWSTSHTVISIQSDSQSFDEIEYTGNIREVAAMVSVAPGGSENAKVYVLTDDWKEFWPCEQKWVAKVQ